MICTHGSMQTALYFEKLTANELQEAEIFYRRHQLLS
jgi:hypothetical protein